MPRDENSGMPVPVEGEDLPATRLVEAQAARKAAGQAARLDALEKDNTALWLRVEALERRLAGGQG